MYARQTTLVEAIVRYGNAPELVSEATWQSWFRTWLVVLARPSPQEIASSLPPASGYELGLLLTDDCEIQAFNARYRGKNCPTDVLAFAALEAEIPRAEEEASLYLGDIIISVETARRQAAAREWDAIAELAWLCGHGLLHLLGWDHPDERRLHVMLAKQGDLLRAIGLRAQAGDPVRPA